MLVLSRSKSQSIHIGDDIVITVVEIRGSRAVLGIAAPDHVAVHREEYAKALAEGTAPASRPAVTEPAVRF